MFSLGWILYCHGTRYDLMTLTLCCHDWLHVMPLTLGCYGKPNKYPIPVVVQCEGRPPKHDHIPFLKPLCSPFVTGLLWHFNEILLMDATSHVQPGGDIQTVHTTQAVEVVAALCLQRQPSSNSCDKYWPNFPLGTALSGCTPVTSGKHRRWGSPLSTPR